MLKIIRVQTPTINNGPWNFCKNLRFHGCFSCNIRKLNYCFTISIGETGHLLQKLRAIEAAILFHQNLVYVTLKQRSKN